MFHLTVEGLPLLENLHELLVDFIAVQLLQYVLLVLKLVLRLPRLLSSLLLLDQRVGVLRLLHAGVARLRLGPLQLRILPVLLRARRVLSICRALQVLSLRLRPLRMLILNLTLVILLLQNIRIVDARLRWILLHALSTSG